MDLASGAKRLIITMGPYQQARQLEDCSPLRPAANGEGSRRRADNGIGGVSVRQPANDAGQAHARRIRVPSRSSNGS